MQKRLLIILFLNFGQTIFGQTNSLSEDSCLSLYIKGGDLNLEYETDSLNKAIVIFDSIIYGECSNDLKNLCLYNKAQALGKLKRNKEALKLLSEENYPESDSIFLSYINQEKYYIHRSINQNKKALIDITRAHDLNPKEDEFHYRKASVLFELKKYDETLIELSKISYRQKYDVVIHDLTSITALKTDNLKLSEKSWEYIIMNKEKYNEKTVITARAIVLLIKQKNGTLSDIEIEQLRNLKIKNINSIMKKEIKQYRAEQKNIYQPN